MIKYLKIVRFNSGLNAIFVLLQHLEINILLKNIITSVGIH